MREPRPPPAERSAAPGGRPAVAIQGEAESFSATAALQLLGCDIRLVPFADVEAAAECVAGGRARYAVLPVENSTVGRVLDLAALAERRGLVVVRRIVVPVRQALVVTGDTVALEELREAWSHPVALAQCGAFFASHAWIAPRAAADTAAAVREVCAAGRRDLAAIGSAAAAALHGGHVLLESVADAADNRTEFALVQRGRLARPLPLEPRRRGAEAAPARDGADVPTPGGER